MVAKVSATLIDFSNEPGQIELNMPDITPANLAGAETSMASLMTALGPVILGNEKQRRFPVVINFSVSPPVDPESQREKKWLVKYRDNSPFLDDDDTVPNPYYGRNFKFTIPTADLTDGNLIPGTDVVDISVTPWTTIIGVLQLAFKSPVGGDMVVTGVTFVGANN